MLRIVFGFLLPVLVAFLAWSFGEPPAKAVFWPSELAEIIDIEARNIDAGYGPMTVHMPVLLLADGETRRLNVPDRHNLTEVVQRWPVGARWEVKLHPDGETAIAAQDSRLNPVIPLIISLGSLLVIGFAVRSYFARSGAMSLIFGGLGAVMLSGAIVMLYAMWTFGRPPSTSFFWPTETVTAAISQVNSRPIGNGNTSWFPIIRVLRENGETVQLEVVRSRFLSEQQASEIAARYSPGTVHEVKRAPDETLFDEYWQFQFTLALIVTLLAPLVAFAGLFAMRASFGLSRRGSL